MPGYESKIAMLGAAAALSYFSFWLTVTAADLEPFTWYAVADPLYYVGFAAMILLCWTQLDLLLIFLVARKGWSKLWIALILWSIPASFGVCTATDTWTSDMRDHVARRP